MTAVLILNWLYILLMKGLLWHTHRRLSATKEALEALRGFITEHTMPAESLVQAVIDSNPRGMNTKALLTEALKEMRRL